VWFVDFEFSAPPGERPAPVCLVAWELGTGKKLRVWQDELKRLRWPPYSCSADSLFVAYYASAELGCHLALGWSLPTNVLDLFVEFRNHTNLPLPCGSGLLGALTWFGLDGIGAEEKESMRQLALRGGPWTTEEKAAARIEHNGVPIDTGMLGRLRTDWTAILDRPKSTSNTECLRRAAFGWRALRG
jgi:hypothetical protein